jgi:hypothetical protein
MTFIPKEPDLLVCPKCKKPITPQEVTIYPSTEEGWFDLAPFGEATCMRCNHCWQIYDQLFLDPSGKINVGKTH